MIIDCHAHVINADDAHLSGILSAADRAGVDRICICSLSRTWVPNPSAEQLDEAADDILAACAAYPERFVGGVYVSADHIDKSLECLERSVAEGPCRFVKLWVSQFADDPRLEPVLERIVELKAPVLAHTWIKATGNMKNESTVHHVVNVARKFPSLKIWFAHCSGRWEEAARIVRDQPNVSVDISGGEPEDGIVECLLKHLEPERIFFGSDIPGRSFVVQMSKVLSAGLSKDVENLILCDNIRRWTRV